MITANKILPSCNKCLCYTCWNIGCKDLACTNCTLEPVTECPGYIGEVKSG
ncbi:MAG: hypothetical protein PHW73_01870 [Atribacterota bacterium]|nr:hypothetical protein [Atribacterota bacterium]